MALSVTEKKAIRDLHSKLSKSHAIRPLNRRILAEGKTIYVSCKESHGGRKMVQD